MGIADLLSLNPAARYQAESQLVPNPRSDADFLRGMGYARLIWWAVL